MFLLGDRIAGGMYGDQPSLASLDDGDLKAGTDFRDVFATLLEGVLDADGPRYLEGYQGKRLPLWLPSRGDYLEHKFQFVHVDDVARLIAYILARTQSDPKLTVLNVAGRGDPLELRRCIDIARIEVQHVPAKTFCKQALRLLWDLGVSDIPPEALPYLLGSSTMDTARLRVFLGEHYRTVIEHTCEEALADSFSAAAQLASSIN